MLSRQRLKKYYSPVNHNAMWLILTLLLMGDNSVEAVPSGWKNFRNFSMSIVLETESK